MKKRFLSVIALATLGPLLAACSNEKNQGSDKQVLNWSIQAELPTADQSLASDAVSFSILNNIGEGLYRLDKNEKPKPALATKTEITNEGKTYTFNLRKGTKWSNGDEVTAKDFVYAWQRTVDPKTNSQYAYAFDAVKNAPAISKGEKSPHSLGIKALGKYKLQVNLTRRVPYFQLLISRPTFFPQNQKAVEKYGKKYGTASKYLVTNGPFTLKNWSGTSLTWKLVKNKSYWDTKDVKLSAINFKVTKATTTSYNLYQTNKLDETLLDSEQAKQLVKNPAYTVWKNARTQYLEFNQTQKQFQNKKIRQAISYAINRDNLTKNVVGAGSNKVTGIVADGTASFKGVDFAKAAKTADGTTYNREKAKKLWAEGLNELGVDSVQFTLLGDDTDVSKKVAEYIQSQLNETLPNIKVIVANVPYKTRLARSTAGDFDVVISAWGADYADPISDLELFTTDNTWNHGKWENEEYNHLIDTSQTEGNKAKRWQLLVKASKLLDQEQAIVPLFQENQAALVKKQVHGYLYHPAGVKFDFKEAYLK
ncbi:peptide ABC transporter substrate-binding protein [Ligilactobacillus equi]|uniref:peptide ABC transporter substrate-binding protein n=1 Tax=Ligilactobacillus equi TaxID=137357 RepID=UPI002ED4C1F5